MNSSKLVILFSLFFLTYNEKGLGVMDSESHMTDIVSTRRCARLIILDSDNRLLLMQIKPDKPADASAPITRPYWVTLGGGVNADETLEAAAKRELGEETGIRTVEIGPRIWHGKWRGTNRINDETYFLVRVPRDTALDHSGLEEGERRVFRAMRWWSVDAIKTSDEIFIPQNLASYLIPIIRGEIPTNTIEIDLSTPQGK